MTRSRTGPRVSTHTVGFDEAGFDERCQASETARLLGTDHHDMLVTVDAVEAARQLAYYFDEPFADSSAIPMYYLSQSVRRA